VSFSIVIKNETDLDIISKQDVSEVILGINELSRNGQLDLEKFYTLSHKAQSLGFKRVLLFDVLLSESNFKKSIELFQSIDHLSYDFIRVQDLGVFNYLVNNCSGRFQLILETSFHNIYSIKALVQKYRNFLDKVILSYELTKKQVLEYSQYLRKLHIRSELLCFGSILLFYTPRKLLSAQDLKDYALANSKESPHKGYEVIENDHGTFMYHLKDLLIFNELKDLEIDKRIDLSHKNKDELANFFKYIRSGDKSFVELLSKKTTRGYFSVNKTDVLFPKLKNIRISRVDESYLGRVLENKKGHFTALKIEGMKKVQVGESLKFINPEGKIINHTIQQMFDLSLCNINQAVKDDIILIASLKKVTPQSKVYLN